MVSTICSIISFRNGFVITVGESLAEFAQNPAPRILVFLAVGDPHGLANDHASQWEVAGAFWIARMTVGFALGAITKGLRTLYPSPPPVSDLSETHG